MRESGRESFTGKFGEKPSNAFITEPKAKHMTARTIRGEIK